MDVHVLPSWCLQLMHLLLIPFSGSAVGPSTHHWGTFSPAPLGDGGQQLAMLTTHLRLALTQHIAHTLFAPLQTLAAQQAEDRAGNEAAFAQARQELALKWQERMSHMQEQLMVNQQQMLGRHEEETASLLVSFAVDSMLAQLETAQPSFGSCRTEGVVLLRLSVVQTLCTLNACLGLSPSSLVDLGLH